MPLHKLNVATVIHKQNAARTTRSLSRLIPSNYCYTTVMDGETPETSVLNGQYRRHCCPNHSPKDVL